MNDAAERLRHELIDADLPEQQHHRIGLLDAALAAAKEQGRREVEDAMPSVHELEAIVRRATVERIRAAAEPVTLILCEEIGGEEGYICGDGIWLADVDAILDAERDR